MVGVIFRYINSNNFYMIEIGGAASKYIQFRKIVNGKIHMISKVEGTGYAIGYWYKLMIYAAGSYFKIYFSIMGEAPLEPFPLLQDEDLREGTIGLSTYMTNAGFDSLRIHPIGDLEAVGQAK